MTAAELARKVFERMLALFGMGILDEARKATEKLDTEYGTHYVAQVAKVVDEMSARLRANFERAIVELRFEFMEVTIAVLDEQTARARVDAAEALERGRKTAEGMDITVVPLCARCGHGVDEHQVQAAPDGNLLRPCFHSEVLSGICTCRDYENREVS